MSQDISNEEAAKLFAQFKAVPADAWNEAPSEELGKALRESGESLPEGIGEREFTTGIRILGQVAHEYDQETFVDVIRTGEMPPMKLSPKEMEVIRGGIIGWVVAGAAAVTAGAHLVGRWYGMKNASHEGHKDCSLL